MTNKRCKFCNEPIFKYFGSWVADVNGEPCGICDARSGNYASHVPFVRTEPTPEGDGVNRV